MGDKEERSLQYASPSAQRDRWRRAVAIAGGLCIVLSTLLIALVIVTYRSQVLLTMAVANIVVGIALVAIAARR